MRHVDWMTGANETRDETFNTASGHQLSFTYSPGRGVYDARASVRMPPPFSSVSVQVKFRDVGRGREVEHILIGPPPNTDITWRLMRAIPIETLQREVDETIRRFQNDETGGSALARELEERFRTRPGRRRRYTKVDYARLAQHYVELCDTGEPTRLLAEELHLSRSRVRDLLSLARRHGVLTTNGRGSYGGELTDEARKLLGLED